MRSFHRTHLVAIALNGSGSTVSANYTSSKFIDNGSEVFGFTGESWPQDLYDGPGERAASTADIPLRFVAASVWDLPVGRGRALPLSGVCVRPVDVEQATNTTRTLSPLQRRNIIGDPSLGRDERTFNRFFNTSEFSAADPLRFGNSPRSPIRGPGLVNFDAALINQWEFVEDRSVDSTEKAFNLTDTPPFLLTTQTTYSPNLPLNRQSLGGITSTGHGRVIQLALKVRFQNRSHT
ncbi:MAG TPA: hypothetical protein VES20_00400 [Bryobacteraceae bacterium]|nr:hypothetical protein [Bryobacteraceae bacterium]